MFEPKDVHYTRRVIIAISICLTLFGLAPATQADACSRLKLLGRCVTVLIVTPNHRRALNHFRGPMVSKMLAPVGEFIRPLVPSLQPGTRPFWPLNRSI